MVGKRFSEWRIDSHAAITDWATSDEYTQNPLLRSSAGRSVAPPDRAAAAGRARPRAAGRQGSFRLERSRPRHDDLAPGGAPATRARRAPGPRGRGRAEPDPPRPARARSP